MRDSISLLSKTLIINNEIYVIENFHVVYQTNELYVSLKHKTKGWVNFQYEKLLPYIKEQITYITK